MYTPVYRFAAPAFEAAFDAISCRMRRFQKAGGQGLATAASGGWNLFAGFGFPDGFVQQCANLFQGWHVRIGFNRVDDDPSSRAKIVGTDARQDHRNAQVFVSRLTQSTQIETHVLFAGQAFDFPQCVDQPVIDADRIVLQRHMALEVQHAVLHAGEIRFVDDVYRLADGDELIEIFDIFPDRAGYSRG